MIKEILRLIITNRRGLMFLVLGNWDVSDLWYLKRKQTRKVLFRSCQEDDGLRKTPGSLHC